MDHHDDYYINIPKKIKSLKEKKKLRLVPKEIVEKHKEEKLERRKRHEERQKPKEKKEPIKRKYDRKLVFIGDKYLGQISFRRENIKSKSSSLQKRFRKKIEKIIIVKEKKKQYKKKTTLYKPLKKRGRSGRYGIPLNNRAKWYR